MKQMLLMSPWFTWWSAWDRRRQLIQEFRKLSFSDVTVGYIAFREALSAAQSNSEFPSAKAALLLSEKVAARIASVEADSAADDKRRLQINFSVEQWNDQKMKFSSMIENCVPCCHLIWSEILLFFRGNCWEG